MFLLVLLGGVFKLELFLPEEYPMAAPKVYYFLSSNLIISIHCGILAVLYYVLTQKNDVIYLILFAASGFRCSINVSCITACILMIH